MKKLYKNNLLRKEKLLNKLSKGNLKPQELINIATQLGNIQNKINITENIKKERNKVLQKFYYQRRKARRYASIIDEFSYSHNLKNDFQQFELIKTRKLNNKAIDKITKKIKETESFYGLTPSLSSGKVRFQVKSKLFYNRAKERENDYDAGDSAINFSSPEKSEFMRSAWDAIKYDNIKDIKYFTNQIDKLGLSPNEKEAMINQLTQWMEKF